MLFRAAEVAVVYGSDTVDEGAAMSEAGTKRRPVDIEGQRPGGAA